jgi:N-acetylmuramoyl-L-alanine amidase
MTFKVALDIGHTARSGGAVSAFGVMEYQFNREAAKTIASQLSELPGVQPFVINESGDPISLTERANRANAADARLFLAVHHDSANDRYLLPTKVGARTFRQTTRFHGFSIFYSEKNHFSAESLRFAQALGAGMRRQGLTPTLHHAEPIPGENRQLVDPELGVYRFDDLVVLKRANMPAVLLECGVIVNPDEEQQLRQPQRRRQTAQAVAEAVDEIAPLLEGQNSIRRLTPAIH